MVEKTMVEKMTVTIPAPKAGQKMVLEAMTAGKDIAKPAGRIVAYDDAMRFAVHQGNMVEKMGVIVGDGRDSLKAGDVAWITTYGPAIGLPWKVDNAAE